MTSADDLRHEQRWCLAIQRGAITNALKVFTYDMPKRRWYASAEEHARAYSEHLSRIRRLTEIADELAAIAETLP